MTGKTPTRLGQVHLGNREDIKWRPRNLNQNKELSHTVMNAVVQFADAIRACGLLVDSVHPDGAIHRVRVDGDRPGKHNGWYVLHADGRVAGAFGNWATGESETWCAHRNSFSAQERESLKASWTAAKQQRDVQLQREQRATQDRAQALWFAAVRPNDRHPYLLNKLVRAHGIRQRNDLLLIPMRDSAGELWTVQTIAREGTKRFLRGSRKQGLYHALGSMTAADGTLSICEGYATAATVHESTGKPVAVAFDAGNLESVAIALRQKYPKAKLIICADNDLTTQERIGRNPGLEAAEKAARAVGATVALPPDGFCDFNDAAQGVLA